MCPPACHPTHEEERELRALTIETINEAVQLGQSQTMFHHFHILAWRLSQRRGTHGATELGTGSVPMEVWIKRGSEVMAHEVGRICEFL